MGWQGPPQLQASAQHAGLPPRLGLLKWNEPGPGPPAFGHQDRLTRMSRIDQAGEVGFGLMHIHGSHHPRQPFAGWLVYMLVHP